jgi:4-amino-4-deoxy-L-arabinose transferase-like glycosyltransferase
VSAPGPRLAVVLLAWIALLHVGTAPWPDIFDELPGQWAGPAWQMVESGEWLVPTLQGVPRLQKPPLVYWLTAASLALFGRNEFAARLPTALALVGCMAVTASIGARLYGPSRGLAAAGILGTSFGMVALGKLVMPEPFLALGIALTLYAAIRAMEEPGGGRAWALAAWGLAALAALTKGLHGLFFPALVLGGVAAVSPASRGRLRRLLTPWGAALALALLLPWPLYIESRFPGYLEDNLLNEQIGHVLDTHFPRDSEPTPLLLLWGQHLLWWFPWIFFVPAALLAGQAWPAGRLAALPVVWLGVVALAASLAGQRQDYHTLSAWPAMALLLSGAWSDAGGGRTARLAHGGALAALLVLGAAGVAAYGPFLWWEGGAGETAPFGERNSVLDAIQGVAGAQWRGLVHLLPLAGAGLLLGAGAAFVLRARVTTREWAWIPLGAGMAGPLLAAVAGLQAVAPLFSLKEIGQALRPEVVGEGLVVFDGPSRRGSSLGFYADVEVGWLERPETEFAVRSRGIGRDRFLTEEDVARRWRQGRVWLVTEERRLPFWRVRLGDGALAVIARSGTRVLVVRSSRAP